MSQFATDVSGGGRGSGVSNDDRNLLAVSFIVFGVATALFCFLTRPNRCDQDDGGNGNDDLVDDASESQCDDDDFSTFPGPGESWMQPVEIAAGEEQIDLAHGNDECKDRDDDDDDGDDETVVA